MNKLSMPDDAQVEKTMTPEQRALHQQEMARWRRDAEDEEQRK